MEPWILVFNPFGSTLEKELLEIIKQEDRLNFYCINKSDLTTQLANIHISIILFILDKHCTSIEFAKIENLTLLYPSVPVIGIFNCSKICEECKFLQKVVWHFLTLPIRKDDLLLIIKLYCTKNEYASKSIYSTLKKFAMFDLFKGESKVSLEIKEKIVKIAQYDTTVLINGETGTGKELSARMIHFLSSRSKNVFIPVNCGAIPDELFENELFGHKKGAYTNAETTETGLIAEANNGTLFLDEIEALPELLQVKLLRFLDEKKYKPLGQSSYLTSNVRIIAAAKDNLWDKVKANQFREDLFYRLNVLNLYLPPLRERTEDIPILVSYFIDRFSKLYNKTKKHITPSAMMQLVHYNWEGNIRELINLIQEAVIMNDKEYIDEEDLNFEKKDKKKFNKIVSWKTAKQKIISDFEKSYLNSLLSIFHGNISRAAKFAQKDRRAFYRLVKKYNINSSIYKHQPLY